MSELDSHDTEAELPAFCFQEKGAWFGFLKKTPKATAEVKLWMRREFKRNAAGKSYKHFHI